MSEHAQGCIDGLPGQVALVTGATRGIGRATAEQLAHYGAQLVVSARSAEDATRVAAELESAHGCRALGIGADVVDREAVQRMIDTALAWSQGRIDILVNNAGYPVVDAQWHTPLHEVPADALDAHYRAVYDVDLRGARNVTHAVLPTMMAQKSGAVVFLSSTPALAGHTATPYTEAKAGLLGLMRDVAKNYGAHGIRANAVAPGNIRTGWAERLSEEQQQRLAIEAPLGRWGEPTEVAKAVLFLASPLSSFITGQTLVIDGGKVIH